MAPGRCRWNGRQESRPSSSPTPTSTSPSKPRCAPALQLRPGLPRTERVYVERPLFDSFVARLKEGAEKLKLGVPAMLPPTWAADSQEHRNKVLLLQPECGDEAPQSSPAVASEMPGELANGAWWQPTNWTGIDENAAVVARKSSGHVRR
jgi:hypothetical protein